VSGNTKSCGCQKIKSTIESNKKNKTKHGMEGTRIYNIWRGMKDRCNNKKSRDYKNYGGRGVLLYDAWNSFENFYEWVKISNYQENLTIDRINTNGNYEPSNCRWTTWLEQENNRRNTVYLTIAGETKPVTQWARENNLNFTTIKERMKRGWKESDLLIPPFPYGKRYEPNISN
jgi:hypothetical protein